MYYVFIHNIYARTHTHTHTPTHTTKNTLQVKHLLILREQLAPFDVEFAAVERRLDFKSTRGVCVRACVRGVSYSGIVSSPS